MFVAVDHGHIALAVLDLDGDDLAAKTTVLDCLGGAVLAA